MATGNPEFFVDSREDLYCPVCNSPLRLRDHRKRICRSEGGERHWVKVGRYRCTNGACHRLHTGLPNFLVKYKQYDAGLIEDVISGGIPEEELECSDHPCWMTAMRWRSWFLKNLAAVKGQIWSMQERFRDLGEEFHGFTESLLRELEERTDPGWLCRILRFLYNSGGALAP